MDIISLTTSPRRKILGANYVHNIAVNWREVSYFTPQTHFLYMQVKGIRYMEDQEGKFSLQPGDVIFFFGGHKYTSYHPHAPYRAMNILFEPVAGDLRLPANRHNAHDTCNADVADRIYINSRIVAKDDPIIRERFYEVVQLANSPIHLRKRKAMPILEDLLFELALRSRPGSGHWSAPIEYVIGFIDKNLDHKISIDKLADLVGMSRRGLTRQFRAATGRSILEYQVEKRISMAASILKMQPRTRLRDIAATLGFYDEFHLSRVFCKHVGIAPSAYRRS